MEHDSLRQRPPVSPQWAIIVETGLVAEQKCNRARGKHLKCLIQLCLLAVNGRSEVTYSWPRKCEHGVGR